MLKKTKIKKFNLFKKLIFTILFGISSICLLGGWTIDSNGNLQSDNLLNENINITQWSIELGNVDLQEGTYHLRLSNAVPGSQIYIDSTRIAYPNYNFSTEGDFTINENMNGTLTLRGTYTNYSGLEWAMLNQGTTALPYEPYGTWYSQSNYEYIENEISLLTRQVEVLEEQIDGLQASLEQITQEYEDYQDLINNTMGTTSFDISQYSVSVGSVPNQPSFDYTLNQTLTNNFTNIGYLNVSDIYSTYIYNNGQINNNNSIYITTPQSNLLTFDMTFNYTTQPNTMIKTTLTLPNGDLQQFAYSSTDFNYKGEWTLANLVASSTIGENYDINDISYKDVIITYENLGNNLSDIKLGSNNGYNTGFNSGYNTALDRINELSVELNEKTTNLQRVTEELTAKTIQYEHLYTRFQQLSDRPLQLNFQSLLWNIASTPFEVFKTMWNFDFLGFNIAQFVTR